MKCAERGWFFSLTKDSDWGDATTFNSQILSDAHSINDNISVIDEGVWGTIDTSQGYPQKGDGIAFYHSSGAFYSGFDYWGKKRRIQMYGIIEEVEFEKRNLKRIKFRIDKKVCDLLRIIPLIRDNSTEVFFNKIIQQHKVYSLYPVSPKLWPEFLRHVSNLHSDANIKRTIKMIKEAYDKKVTALDRLRMAEDLAVLGAMHDSIDIYERILNIHNSEIGNLEWNISIWSYYADSVTQYQDTASRNRLLTQLTDRLLEEYYDVPFVVKFIASEEVTMFLIGNGYLDKAIEYLCDNLYKDIFSHHSGDIFSIIKSLITIEHTGFQSHIVSLLRLIYKFTKDDLMSYLSEFTEISALGLPEKTKSYIYNYFKSECLNITSRVMIEVLFASENFRDFTEIMDDFVHGLANADKVKVILNLHNRYNGRFVDYSRGLLSDVNLGDKNIDLDSLFGLLLISAEIYSNDISSRLSIEIVKRIKEEFRSQGIIDNILSYALIIFEHFCSADGSDLIIHNTQILSAVLNSINHLNNDSRVAYLLSSICRHIDSLSDYCSEESESDIYSDNLLEEISVYKLLLNSVHERLIYLKSDFPKSDLSWARKKLGSLEKLAMNKNNKSK